MDIKQANLQLEKHYISSFAWVEVPDENHENIRPRIEDIDIDFNIYQGKDDSDLFKITLSIVTKQDVTKPLPPGTFFNIHLDGFFEVPGVNEMEEGKLVQLLNYSAVPMLISHARGYLYHHSLMTRAREWYLPSIDLADLINKKAELEKDDLDKVAE